MNRPILSICIPTYNRAAYLWLSLSKLLPQVERYKDDVEVLISDNCSTDNTVEIIENYKKNKYVKYERNDTNIGAVSNVLKLINTMAAGTFCWVLPDDDMIAPGAVERVLDEIDKHKYCDFIGLNSISVNSENRSEIIKRLDSGQYDINNNANIRVKKKINNVKKWDDLLDPNIDPVFFGAIMFWVFRRSVWCGTILKTTTYNSEDPFPSLEMTYPHSVVFAATMISRPARFINEPCIFTFWGEQEWRGFVPMIYLVRLHELLDLYRECGVAKERVDICKKHLLNTSGGFLRLMIEDENTPGKKYFSLPKFVYRNKKYPKELVRLFRTLVRTIVSKILRSINVAG